MPPMGIFQVKIQTRCLEWNMWFLAKEQTVTIGSMMQKKSRPFGTIEDKSPRQILIKIENAKQIGFDKRL